MSECPVDAIYRAACRWAFGRESIEPVVRLACELLVTGWDGEHVATLAGVSVSETERDGRVRRDVERALEELGHPLPAEGSDDASAIASNEDPAFRRLLAKAVGMLVDDFDACYPGLLSVVTPTVDQTSYMIRDWQGSHTGVWSSAYDLDQALYDIGQQLVEIKLEAWWSLTGHGDVPNIICAEHPESVIAVDKRDDIPVWVCAVENEVIAAVGELKSAANLGRVKPGLRA